MGYPHGYPLMGRPWDRMARDIGYTPDLWQGLNMFKWAPLLLTSRIIGTQFWDWLTETSCVYIYARDEGVRDVRWPQSLMNQDGQLFFWDIALLSCLHVGWPCCVVRFHCLNWTSSSQALWFFVGQSIAKASLVGAKGRRAPRFRSKRRQFQLSHRATGCRSASAVAPFSLWAQRTICGFGSERCHPAARFIHLKRWFRGHGLGTISPWKHWTLVWYIRSWNMIQSSTIPFLEDHDLESSCC